MESSSDPDNLLCFPSVAAVVSTAETHAKCKPDGGSIHIRFSIVLFYHMKSFHGFLVLDCSVYVG